MKAKTMRWVIAAVVLIVAGAAVYGIGRSTVSGNEGSIIMENQSYALSEVSRIQIDTDSPNVVIKSVVGDRINLSWEEDKYLKCELSLVNGIRRSPTDTRMRAQTLHVVPPLRAAPAWRRHWINARAGV
jgi:hypothetical protein